MTLLRHTHVEIDLSKINHNINEIKNFINDETKLAMVIKANAYGHGAIEMCKNINLKNIDYICVATLSEALELRENNVKLPILVMGDIPKEHFNLALKNDITITVFLLEQAYKIDEESKRLNKKGKIHIKIDTGFNRLGFKLDDNIDELKLIFSLENLYIEGIYSHLALVDKKMDYIQFNRFNNIIDKISKYKNIPIKHICDSIGMVAYKNFHMDMVRVGASIYGYNSRETSLNLQESITFKSKIVQIKKVYKGEGIGYDYSYISDKDKYIGIIPCGYADGIPRQLSNKGYVMVNNKQCDILGKICMDQMVIDLSNLDKHDYDKDVIFYGENGPSILEIASLCNTNRNEIMSLISKRVERVYKK